MRVLKEKYYIYNKAPMNDNSLMPLNNHINYNYMKSEVKVHEIFLPIPGWPNYEVSNLGNVKSRQGIKPRILKTSPDKDGYDVISLSKNNNKITAKIHQLVALVFFNHFTGKDNLVIDHINNIKDDNRLENLQLITIRENSSKDRKGYTSKFIGVSKHKNGKWISSIQINGKVNYLGIYKTELAASDAYQNKLKNLN